MLPSPTGLLLNAFDDFAAGGVDAAANRRMLGLEPATGVAARAERYAR